MTQRSIYPPDGEWAWWRVRAEACGLSVSEWVTEMVGAAAMADLDKRLVERLATRQAVVGAHATPPSTGAARSGEPRVVGEARSEEHTSELQSPDHIVC